MPGYQSHALICDVTMSQCYIIATPSQAWPKHNPHCSAGTDLLQQAESNMKMHPVYILMVVGLPLQVLLVLTPPPCYSLHLVPLSGLLSAVELQCCDNATLICSLWFHTLTDFLKPFRAGPSTWLGPPIPKNPGDNSLGTKWDDFCALGYFCHLRSTPLISTISLSL